MISLNSRFPHETLSPPIKSPRTLVPSPIQSKQTHIHLMDGTVTLNIGGKTYQVYKETLELEPSLFKMMLSDKYKQPVDKTYFVDRDSKYFSFILNYLRTKKLDFDNFESLTGLEIIRMREEVEYYNLDSLLTIFDLVFSKLKAYPTYSKLSDDQLKEVTLKLNVYNNRFSLFENWMYLPLSGCHNLFEHNTSIKTVQLNHLGFDNMPFLLNLQKLRGVETIHITFRMGASDAYKDQYWRDRAIEMIYVSEHCHSLRKIALHILEIPVLGTHLQPLTGGSTEFDQMMKIVTAMMNKTEIQLEYIVGKVESPELNTTARITLKWERQK